MSELLFVIKSFVFTMAIIVLMQVKVGNASIERHSQWFLQKSEASLYVQSVAAGGALALKNLFFSVKSGVMDTADSFRQGSRSRAIK